MQPHFAVSFPVILSSRAIVLLQISCVDKDCLLKAKHMTSPKLESRLCEGGIHGAAPSQDMKEHDCHRWFLATNHSFSYLALCLFDSSTVTLIFSFMWNIVSENDVIFTRLVHGQGPDNLGTLPPPDNYWHISILYCFNSPLNTEQPFQTSITS